jgi:hypothetical protein
MKRLRPLSRRSHWKLLAAAAVAVTAMIAFAPTAAAAIPHPASGSFLLTSSTETSSTEVGGRLIVTEINTGLFFGTLNGPFVTYLTRVIHPSSGYATFTGSGTFTGVVDGHGPGTINFDTEGIGAAFAPRFQATFRTTSGTGGLSNVKVFLGLLLNPVTVPFGTYAGTYFD